MYFEGQATHITKTNTTQALKKYNILTLTCNSDLPSDSTRIIYSQNGMEILR